MVSGLRGIHTLALEIGKRWWEEGERKGWEVERGEKNWVGCGGNLPISWFAMETFCLLGHPAHSPHPPLPAPLLSTQVQCEQLRL